MKKDETQIAITEGVKFKLKSTQVKHMCQKSIQLPTWNESMSLQPVTHWH